MNLKDFAEIIVPVVLTLITALGGYIAKFVKTNETAKTIVQILPALAKSAVIAMEKAGVLDNLTGDQKMQQAIEAVQNALKKLGITSADITMIEHAIEKEFAIIKQAGELDMYPQNNEPIVEPKEENDK